jgi:hypothetical protein
MKIVITQQRTASMESRTAGKPLLKHNGYEYHAGHTQVTPDPGYKIVAVDFFPDEPAPAVPAGAREAANEQAAREDDTRLWWATLPCHAR